MIVIVLALVGAAAGLFVTLRRKQQRQSRADLVDPHGVATPTGGDPASTAAAVAAGAKPHSKRRSSQSSINAHASQYAAEDAAAVVAAAGDDDVNKVLVGSKVVPKKKQHSHRKIAHGPSQQLYDVVADEVPAGKKKPRRGSSSTALAPIAAPKQQVYDAVYEPAADTSSSSS